MTNYWLMKSEPDTFGIDDLKARPNQTEPWNGVRNYQARNYIRAMEVNDLAFFYHSSCKVPGIVGIMKIVKSAYMDQEPLWSQVDVKFVKKFKDILSLEQLRQIPELKSMRILQKGNRLSITPVSKSEWEKILKLVAI